MTRDIEKGSRIVPQHIAVVMDGNGRWAKRRSLPRLKGHEAGAESVRAAIRACRDAGVKYLTLYAFSVENWVRPRAEINGLMSLLRKFLQERVHELHENEVRLRVAGRMEDLDPAIRKELERVMADTCKYDRGHLILALSYGGRTEIAAACRKIAARVKNGEIDPSDIDEGMISANMYLPDVPDPDLMIRTSGEKRLSNFLLWQNSYSEFYFTDVLWPDFREKELNEAIEEYGRRHRRYGQSGDA